MTRRAEVSSGIEEEVLGQAIHWAVKLQSGTTSDAERSACVAWRAAHPAHEQTWQELQVMEQVFRSAAGTGQLAYRTLQSAAERRPLLNRRGLLKVMGLGAVGLAIGALPSWQQRTGYATAIGELRSMGLADGSRLKLNTDSAADVVFSPLRRLVALRRGEIFIETGRDASSLVGPRPFWVETVETRLEAFDGRFAVRQLAGSTQLHVEHGSVAIHAGASPTVLVRAGENYAIGAGVAPQPLFNPVFDATAWADGALIARQMRLDAFVVELARYRGGPLRCDSAAAALRISGVFQLDGRDPAERVLAVLARTLPVKLVRGPGNTVTLIHA